MVIIIDVLYVMLLILILCKSPTAPLGATSYHFARGCKEFVTFGCVTWRLLKLRFDLGWQPSWVGLPGVNLLNMRFACCALDMIELPYEYSFHLFVNQCCARTTICSDAVNSMCILFSGIFLSIYICVCVGLCSCICINAPRFCTSLCGLIISYRILRVLH